MKRWRSVVGPMLVTCATGLLVSCGGATPASPSVSAETAGRPPELRLSSPPELNLPGDRFHLSLNNGAGADVGSAAVWQSSAPQVAEASAGDVHAVAAGAATITVTYAGVSVETRIAVVGYGVVDGAVHEMPPTASIPVAGATVTVAGGRFDGRTTSTDSSGRFRLA